MTTTNGKNNPMRPDTTKHDGAVENGREFFGRCGDDIHALLSRVAGQAAEIERLRAVIENLPDEVEISRLINANLGKPNTSVAGALAERLAYAEQALKGGA